HAVLLRGRRLGRGDGPRSQQDRRAAQRLHLPAPARRGVADRMAAHRLQRGGPSRRARCGSHRSTGGIRRGRRSGMSASESSSRSGASEEPEKATPGTADDPRLITQALLREWSLPAPTGTKYSRGQVTVIGGARRSPGGAMLAGIAALRMGAGRLSIAVAESVAPPVDATIP